MEIVVGGVEIFDVSAGDVIMEHTQIEPDGSATRRIWRAVVEWPLICKEAIPLYVVIVRVCESGMGSDLWQEWSENAREKKDRDQDTKDQFCQIMHTSERIRIVFSCINLILAYNWGIYLFRGRGVQLRRHSCQARNVTSRPRNSEEAHKLTNDVTYRVWRLIYVWLGACIPNWNQ